MNSVTKFVIYMILIANCEQNLTKTSQALDADWKNDVRARTKENHFEKLLRVLRVRRQDPVVQPEWTADDGITNLFVDYNVRVTDRKLQETEALREMIQETVDKDSYAVELDESDFKNVETDVESNSETELFAEQPETEPEQVSVSEPQSESESESQSEPESIVEAEPASEAGPVSESESVSGSEPESQPESVSGSEPESQPESVSGLEPESEPESVSEVEPISEIVPVSEPEAETVSAPETASEAKPVSESEPLSQPENALEPELKSEAAEPKPQPESALNPKQTQKLGVANAPKQKPKKIGKVPAVTPCSFLKKIGGYDLLSSTFAEWLKKTCVPPWCKDGSSMWSFLYN